MHTFLVCVAIVATAVLAAGLWLVACFAFVTRHPPEVEVDEDWSDDQIPSFLRRQAE